MYTTYMYCARVVCAYVHMCVFTYLRVVCTYNILKITHYEASVIIPSDITHYQLKRLKSGLIKLVIGVVVYNIT